MQKAIFIDRDGVINKERGEYTYKPEDFEILPHVFECIQHWNKQGFLVIIITNQGGIAKSLYQLRDLYALNEILFQSAKENDAVITDIYYCPHHPDFGNCLCRKPNSLMFEKAIAKYNINPLKSYMIGDKERDILPAKALGIKTFQIEANSELKKLLPLLV